MGHVNMSCKSFVPTCDGYQDWNKQFHANYGPVKQCMEKHLYGRSMSDPCGQACRENGFSSLTSAECSECLGAYCPNFPAYAECAKCVGRAVPDDRGDFANCADCGGSSATYMPLEPGKYPTPQYPSSGSVEGGGGGGGWWIVALLFAAIALFLYVSRG